MGDGWATADGSLADWSEQLRQQREQLLAIVAALAESGDPAGAARLTEQLDRLDGLLAGPADLVDRSAAGTLVRGMLALAVTQAGALLRVVEPGPATGAQRHLRLALGAGQALLDNLAAAGALNALVAVGPSAPPPASARRPARRPPESPQPITSTSLAPLRTLAELRRTLARTYQASPHWTAVGLQPGFDVATLAERTWPATGSGVDTGPAAQATRQALGSLLAAHEPRMADWLAQGAPPATIPPARLTPTGLAALRDDLAALDAPRLMGNLPRDRRGQLELGQEVLLASYETVYDDGPVGRRSVLWLIAQLPERRRDAAVVTLTVDLRRGDARRHRWDEARWLWDGRAVADEAARWGVAGLPLTRLGLAERGPTLARWRAQREARQLSPADRAGLALLLQDEGALVEAFETTGVELDPALLDLLSGTSTAPPTTREAESWPAAVQECLRAAAPWRFHEILATEEQRRAPGAGGRRRGGRSPRLRLLALPNQPQVRKTSIMLVRSTSGGPRLELETTGADAILAEVRWQRPVELDLTRFGLVDQPAPDTGS